MPDQPASPAPDRTHCRILNWRVFEPGYHKNKLYSLADCQRMARNFRLLSTGPKPALVPVAALGHDPEGRYMASLGFPNVGRITRADCDPSGVVSLDLDKVPVDVGGEVSAGRLNTGSIELIDELPHPQDQSKVVQGPILTGTAILGEEQPQLKGFAPPRAVFPDGTPVPPSPSQARWLNAMAATVERHGFSTATPFRPRPVNYLGRTFFAATIAFSEMFRMDRATILDQLSQKGFPVDDPEISGKSDAELEQLLNNVGQSGFSAKRVGKAFSAMKGKCFSFFSDLKDTSESTDTLPVNPTRDAASGGSGADQLSPIEEANRITMSALDGVDADASAPPAMQQMSKAFRAFAGGMGRFAADCTKRFGALEAATTDAQKEQGEAKMSTFAAAVTAAKTRGALTPLLAETYIRNGKAVAADRQAFAAGPHRGLTPLAALTAEVEALPAGPTHAEVLDEVAPGEVASGSFEDRALRRIVKPKVAK